jgi:tRNA modification GTPase
MRSQVSRNSSTSIESLIDRWWKLSQRSSYFSNDRIYALASPVGGAICVLRVSGDELIPLLKSLGFSASLETFNPKTLCRLKIISPVTQLPIDDAMFSYFQGPKSYTGEDVIEFFLHGSSAVVSELIEALRYLGCRQALAGEFSFRAVRNGKLTITQAQAVAELISAKNTEAVSVAIEKLEGTQQAFLVEIAEELRNLAAFGELSIDFSDQDVEEVSLPRLQKRLEALLRKLERLQGSFSRGQLIQDGVKLAILGLPNAGKSSFFNYILGEDRSIVSTQAGTTRDVIRETLTLKGSLGKSVTLRIQDTAGVRGATDEVEKIGVARSIKAAIEADLLLIVTDPTDEESRREWPNFIQALSAGINLQGRVAEGRVFLVHTKKDLQLNESESTARNLFIDQTRVSFSKVIEVSSLSGEGVSQVVDSVVLRSLELMGREQGEIILTRLDHLQAVSETISHLSRGLKTRTEDLFAADVRQGLVSLGPVIGDTLPDDILGKIFSEFCIGK